MVNLMTKRSQKNHFEETSFPDSTDWNAVKWHKVEKYVDKMQKQIYRAVSEKDFRKARYVQIKLFNSESALLLAIRRVTQINKGKRTPGIDGYRALTDKKRAELFDTMKNMNIKLHNPKPAYRKYIKKKNGKFRSLGIPVIKDRICQELVRMVLEPQVEVNFEPTSYGFRPQRGCHDAESRIMNNIMHGNWSWIFEGDFKSCFDSLDHNFILKQIKGFPLYNLVEKFLKAGYVDSNVLYSSNRGTPQGGILSPLLANIALDGLEELLNISYRKRTRDGYVFYVTEGNYRVVRYADDFVIFANSKEDIEAVYDILNPYLRERGLELAEEKTRITHIMDGFDFLGFNFRRYKTFNGFINLCKPSKESIKRFKSKVTEICKQFHGQSVDALIDRLNPFIRGTANYWKPTNAKKIFSDMDKHIWRNIYKFVRRLHPNKPWNWIKKKYFPRYYDGKYYGNWVLTGPKKGNILTKMAWTPIRRHVMIKYNYSPYDKSKSEYFMKRNSFC